MNNPFEQEIARFEEMKSYFSVDFERGLVTRIKKTSTKGKIGDIIKAKTFEGYIKIGFKGKSPFAHRFIFYCYHGTLYPIIDHKDTVKDNNWISNLRGGTVSQNQQNIIKPQSNNTTGYLGVSWVNRDQKYAAQIIINRKRKNLGLFKCPIEAHQAYLTAKRQLHEFCTI